MSPRKTVPVTAAVVDWAIKESGYPPDELATQLRVPADTLRAWATGEAQPGFTQLRALAGKLKQCPGSRSQKCQCANEDSCPASVLALQRGCG